MIYKAKKGQVSYGEAIGILMLDTFTPFIPGDVGNASTYSFPVRYKTVEDLTVSRMLSKEISSDPSVIEPLIKAGKELVKEGVKAITGDCGYMALFQKELADELGVPVFLSSLLQIPFIKSIIGHEGKIGIMCANSETFNSTLLQRIGIENDDFLCVKGLQEKENFYKSIVIENGILEYEKIEAEMVKSAEELVQDNPDIKAILLECSVMPPYGAAVQRAVNLPVFDFVTMINYVYSAVVKREYEGFM